MSLHLHPRGISHFIYHFFPWLKYIEILHQSYTSNPNMVLTWSCWRLKILHGNYKKKHLKTRASKLLLINYFWILLVDNMWIHFGKSWSWPQSRSPISPPPSLRCHRHLRHPLCLIPCSICKAFYREHRCYRMHMQWYFL